MKQNLNLNLVVRIVYYSLQSQNLRVRTFFKLVILQILARCIYYNNYQLALYFGRFDSLTIDNVCSIKNILSNFISLTHGQENINRKRF